MHCRKGVAHRKEWVQSTLAPTLTVQGVQPRIAHAYIARHQTRMDMLPRC